MKRLKPWQKNLLFALVVLAAAALLLAVYRAQAPQAEALEAVVDFGDGITETLPLGRTTITCMKWVAMSSICR